MGRGTNWAGRVFLLLALVVLVGSFGATRLSAQISGSRWRSIGPSPIEGLYGGSTGRATVLAVNPMNGDQVFLGSAAGGVWFTPDRGVQWFPLSDDQAALAVGAILVEDCDSSGCDRIYVGTGENAIRRDTYHGAGLLIGDRVGGPTEFDWTYVPAGPGFDFRVTSIQDIVRRGSDLFLITSIGKTTSSSQATVTAPFEPQKYGVFRSTDDGLGWSKIDTIPVPPGSLPTDLELAGSNLLVGILNEGLFRSDDGGTTWCPISPSVPPVEDCPPSTWPGAPPLNYDWVEVAVHSANTFYASFGDCTDPLIAGCKAGLYRTDDGGDSWTRKAYSGCVPPTIMRGYSRYTHLLEVSPHDPETLWLGAVELYLSTNGGTFFSQMDNGRGVDQIHLDHHDLVYHPTETGTAYETNDGGFAVLTGDGWVARNTGLAITGFYSVQAYPQEGGYALGVFGGTQDNGIVYWNGSPSWQHRGFNQDGGFVALDPNDPDVRAFGYNYGMIWATRNGGIPNCLLNQRFIAGTSTKESIPDDPDHATIPYEARAFNAPFIYGASGTAFHGTDRLYRGEITGSDCSYSADPFITWKQIGPVIGGGYPDPFVEICRKKGVDYCAIECAGDNVVTAIAEAPTDPDRLYFGSYTGGIHFSSDGTDPTPTWAFIGNGLPDHPITRIAVDPEDPDTILVALASFDAASTGLWRGVRNGEFSFAWTEVLGLPVGVPVNTVHYEPGGEGRVWVGLDSNSTGVTVWRSLDGGMSWNTAGNGLPNVPVHELELLSLRNLAFAATHGRGMWMLQGQSILFPHRNFPDVGLSDLFVYGVGFEETDEACTLELKREDGSSCGSSSTDAGGALLSTDADGRVRANLQDLIVESPLVRVCIDGSCAGGISLDQCDLAQNPLDEIELRCGIELTKTTVGTPFVVAGPPTASLHVGAPSNDGGIDLTVVVQSSDATTRSLCSVRVPMNAGDTEETVVTRIAEALNADATCAQSGMRAEIEIDLPLKDVEDAAPRRPAVLLDAAQLSGSQMIAALHAAPGDATGQCLMLRELGVDMWGQLQAMELRFEAGSQGAEGGSIRVRELSDLGECALSVPLAQGDDAQVIAQKVHQAFQQPGIPGPPGCPVTHNPRDATVPGVGRVRFAVARALEVCIDDAATGFALRPAALSNSHPAAIVATATDVLCTTPDEAMLTLDASGSTDPDSTPGTNDDIVAFEWYEEFGGGNDLPLGSGPNLVVPLGFGQHTIRLTVQDATGLLSSQSVDLDLVDPMIDPDQDGLGSACDNCPLMANDQSDLDNDGAGDVCDCADQDGSAHHVPDVVTGLVVARGQQPLTVELQWQSLKPQAGDGVLYDVIRV